MLYSLDESPCYVKGDSKNVMFLIQMYRKSFNLGKKL